MRTEIIIGDTLDFETTVPDYPATDGWTLKFRLVPRVSGSAITFNASTASDGVSYRAQVAPATTAAWTAGEYSWTSYVEKTGARQTVQQGMVTLIADPAVTTAPYDRRSHARKTLDAIEAVLENRASLDQQEYTIGDRSLKRMPIADLLDFKRYYAGLVAKEEDAIRIANGQKPKNRTQARL